MSRSQFTSDRFVESSITKGTDEIEMADGDASAGPGDDLAMQLGARQDRKGNRR
jgi:hypothetical protein